MAVGAVLVATGYLNLPNQDKELTGKAPAIEAKLSDGKDIKLADLTKDGPVYLYFVKKDCPVNAKAIDFYNSIYKAYSDKAPIVAVFNGTADELKEYNKTHATPYRVILDRDHKIVESYKVERSPWVIEVDRSGLVGKIWKAALRLFLVRVARVVCADAWARSGSSDAASCLGGGQPLGHRREIARR